MTSVQDKERRERTETKREIERLVETNTEESGDKEGEGTRDGQRQRQREDEMESVTTEMEIREGQREAIRQIGGDEKTKQIVTDGQRVRDGET